MKILICDDHKIVREGLKQILLQMNEVTFIGEAGAGNEALEMLKVELFDFLLLDISLPDISGLEVLQLAKQRFPKLKVLMLSMRPQEQYALRSMKLGASGYLTKDTASEELFKAIKAISKGEVYLSSQMASELTQQFVGRKVMQKHESLSAREFEIMIMFANGKSPQDIAAALFISPKTVSTYRSRFMEKMEFSQTAELTKYCIENELI